MNHLLSHASQRAADLSRDSGIEHNHTSSSLSTEKSFTSQLPPCVHPDNLRRGASCFISIRDINEASLSATKILGPYMFLRKLDTLPDGGLPTAGHPQFLALSMSPKRWDSHRVIAPRDGQSVILNQVYTLHMATREHLMHFCMNK